MIGAAAAYMSGLFFASFFTEGSGLLLAGCLISVLFVVTRFVKISTADFLILAIFFGISCTAGTLYNQFVYNETMKYSGTTGSFAGKITDVEYYDGDKAGFTAKGKINGKQSAKIKYLGEPVTAEYGDVIYLENCEFESPDSDYLFDYKDYYKSKGIFLNVFNSEKFTVERRDTSRFMRAVMNYRERMISEFRIELGTENGSFLAGLVFGEKSLVEDTEKTLLYRCGIGHILAVSGLHVSILACMLMIILKILKAGKYFSFLILNVFMALLIIIAETPVSGIRAAIMLDFMYSAKIFRRQNDSFNSISAAVLVLCLSNPYIIHDAGFLLSVTATIGIAVFAPYMTKNMRRDSFVRRIGVNLVTMLCVMLMILPVNLIFFDEVSIISPITNILMLPLSVLSMIIAMIYVITAGTVSLLSISDILINLIRMISDKIGRFEFSHISSNSLLIYISVLSWAAIILIGALLKKQRYIALMISGCVAVMTLMSSVNKYRNKDVFRAAVLGSGSNASVVIISGNRTDIIDLSGNYKAPKYVRKYLDSNGISQIQTLTFTERSPSQYMAYMSSLELLEVQSMYSEYDAAASRRYVECFGEHEFELENDNYSFKYSDRILTVEYNGVRVVFSPANSENMQSADAVFYYGRRKKNSTSSQDGFYLDEMNNTEVIFTSSGIKLRRL